MMTVLGFLYLSGLVLVHTPCRYYVVGPASVLILIHACLSGTVKLTMQRMVLYLTLVILMLDNTVFHVETFARTLAFVLPGMASLVVCEGLSYWRPKPRSTRKWLGAMVFLTGCGLVWPVFSNPNSLGSVFVFLLYLSDEFAAPMRRYRWFTVAVATTGVTLTGSRASALFLIAYLVLSALRTRRRQALAFVVAALAVILTYGMGVLSLPDINLYGRSISYTAGRDILWRGGLDLVRQYPLGMGYASYGGALMDVLGYDNALSLHNVYLDTAAQFGIPFLALYLAYVCTLFRRNHSSLAWAFALAVYLHGFFESATPFGYSLQSAMLLLPLYLGVRSGPVGRRTLQ